MNLRDTVFINWKTVSLKDHLFPIQSVNFLVIKTANFLEEIDNSCIIQKSNVLNGII